MATYESYSTTAKSLKEDLTGFITNIDPDSTWCLSNFGRTTAKSSVHLFQTDTLASPAANAQSEGFSFSSGTLSASTRLTNYTQIMAKQITISESNNAMDHAGMKDQVAYQTTKAGKELARDIEYALLINTTADIGSSGSARKLKGLAGWITTNTATGTTGTANPFTGNNGSAILNSLLATMWDAGAKPKHIICGSANKLRISTFTANNTRWTAADNKSITNAVDLYKSDFGDIAVHPHYIMSTAAAGTVLVLGDLDLWKVAYLRPVKNEEIAKTGDARNFLMVTELTLEGRNEKGSGKITLS